MKLSILALMSLLSVVAGGAMAADVGPSAKVPGVAPPPHGMPGADRDAHGCIGSAGYSWCARENKCVRPWELAKDKGLASTEAAFDAYCTGTR
ncbi:peptidase [Candidatus Thiodictyon syntrophicum]|jgi:hypothetical protein|uniref:Peptidase n=1 Tax=Candidatus Thiodictyon syntrophicum TaxID=1166950 RepID=A0A2K8U5A7_9GAMM|nr:peptidase [Candidatus Thiodictyon syntrophicum]AUB80725.1 hypothetical protein THSYN_07010 [Candidatus Thiodictyon syntrophicum]